MKTESVMMMRQSRRNTMQTTLFLVLGAETILFGTLVMAYLFLRNGGSAMHFSHPKPLDVMIASLNTLLLLISTVFARNGLRAIVKAQVQRLNTNLMLALTLGTIFIAVQIFEFNHAGMRINDFTFGGVFFALISFHAAHVLAGVIILAINVVRARLGDFSARRHVAITMGTWFWYYVAAVWIVLFTVLYLV